MKRLLNIIALLTMCIFAGITLSGCAPLFDALNFNRRPLPNPESEIEGGLTNPYVKSENALTKAEFSELIENSLEDRIAFEDMFTLTYSRPKDSYMSYARNYYVRTKIVSHLDKNSGNGVGYTLPYANYYERIVRYDRETDSKNLYFYNDYFVDSNEYTRFLIDDYIDDLKIESYETIKSGGLLPTVLSVFEENLDSAYYDYSNGEKVLVLSLKNDVMDALKQEYPADFLPPQGYGDFLGAGKTEILFADGMVTGIKTSFNYNRGSLTFDFYSNYEDLVIPQPNHYEATAHSYVYKTLYLSKSYFPQNTEYAERLIPFKATINHSDGCKLDEVEKSGTFNYYCVPSEAHVEGNQNSPSKYMNIYELDGETLYYTSDMYNKFIFIEKNNAITRIEDYYYGGDLKDKYFGIVYSMESFFRDSFKLFDTSQQKMTKTTSGYSIETIYFSGYYDNYLDQDVIEYSYSRIFEVNEDFSKILSFTLEEYYYGETISISIDFSYDFSFDVPFEISDLNYREKR